jgi:1,4-alpha-glucan branching enzyme
MWEEENIKISRYYKEKLGSDIIGGFKNLQDKGYIEIITCAATHGYLPLLATDESVRAQIFTGVSSYARHFGRKPRGLWLPECAYRPSYEWKPPVGDYPAFERLGVEEVLHEAGIEWTILDSHLLTGGTTQGVYIDRYSALKALWARFADSYVPKEGQKGKSMLYPYMVSSTGKPIGTAVFFRDPDTGLQVWSGEWGYPGNPAYLDFHKKHYPGGHRYWRVTDCKADLADKKSYHPEWIDGVLEEQASHFVALVYEKIKDGGVLTAPFDAELFGHWWFEGPRWISKVFRAINKTTGISCTTGSEALAEYPPSEILKLPEGSWGQGGFHYIWLNEWTEWTWKHVYPAEMLMTELVEKWEAKGSDKNIEKVLAQAARELLLLESSDWPFLISTWAARDYAEIRIAFHVEAFNRLADSVQEMLDGKQPSLEEHTRFALLAEQDDPFPQIDIRLWSKIKK